MLWVITPIQMTNSMSARKLAIVGFGLLTLSWTGLGSAAVPRVSSHLAGTDCNACHLVGPTEILEKNSNLIESEERLCVACHERARQFSHPTGFAPGRTLPAEYPLDRRGYLTCSTCHQPHGFEPGLLRGTKRAKDFCLTCHDQSFVDGMKDAGASLVISGHLDIGNGRGTPEIDAHSLHCLSCHAGSHSGSIAVSFGRSQRSRAMLGLSSAHPIGNAYGDVRNKMDFYPEYLLEERNIRLSDGRISCISCHETYTKNHGKLTVTLDQSKLCLGCHKM